MAVPTVGWACLVFVAKLLDVGVCVPGEGARQVLNLQKILKLLEFECQQLLRLAVNFVPGISVHGAVGAVLNRAYKLW